MYVRAGLGHSAASEHQGIKACQHQAEPAKKPLIIYAYICENKYIVTSMKKMIIFIILPIILLIVDMACFFSELLSYACPLAFVCQLLPLPFL